MAFKIYKNRKTKHPSISLKSGDKKRWHNLEVTHHPTLAGRYIEIDDLNPNVKGMAFVRKYYRKDKHKVKGFRYKDYMLSYSSERKVKKYLKKHCKKKR